jgi:hypothetical protein
MPTVKKRSSKFADDEIVVAWESFAGHDIRVVAGVTRLRADHPIVKRCPQFFTKDGTPSDELTRLRQAYYADSFPEPVQDPTRTIIEERVRDEDALVCTRGLLAGTRVHRRSRAALTAPPGTYVPVMDKAMDRRNCLEARETLRVLGEDGKPTRVVYAGQLVHRDDQLVAIHPHAFGLPAVELNTREEA